MADADRLDTRDKVTDDVAGSFPFWVPGSRT